MKEQRRTPRSGLKAMRAALPCSIALSITCGLLACHRDGREGTASAPSDPANAEGPKHGSLEGESSAGESSEADVAARATALVRDSPGWVQVTVVPLPKMTPCAASLPKDRFGDEPNATHRQGEKYHTLVLPSAAAAYRNHETLPTGAALIKKTFIPETGQVTSYFVMFKTKSMNVEGGRWVYATTEPDGTPIRAGVLADCAGCHAQRKGDDYVFGAPAE